MQHNHTPKIKNALLATFGHWQVYQDGELRHTNGEIVIYPDRLPEPDWWIRLHVTYEWMATEWNDFMPAWALALKQAGISTVRIKTQL